MHYEFYLDVYVLTNFFFDYLTLLTIRELRSKGGSMKRLAVGALFGVVCSTFLMLKSKGALWYFLIVHLMVNPLMVYISFRQKRWKEFLTDYAICYVLILLLGGIVSWVAQNSFLGQYLWMVAGAAALMMTVVMILYRSGREEEQIYDIRIQKGETVLEEKGFYDTGNLLMDPYLKVPVSLIGKNTLEKIEGVRELPFRYIPFVSLGKEHGIVKAVTLDVLYIQMKEREVVVKPAVFAVVEDEFLKSNEYQVILNGRLK